MQKTLKVTARFVGAVKQLVNEEQRTLALKRGTVRELLDTVVKLHPQAKDKLKQVGVFIEGRMIKDAELNEPILRDGQEVSLIMPVAGG
jgi:molybdopterin converting factor small subunit